MTCLRERRGFGLGMVFLDDIGKVMDGSAEDGESGADRRGYGRVTSQLAGREEGEWPIFVAFLRSLKWMVTLMTSDRQWTRDTYLYLCRQMEKVSSSV
jgi:hypothetical protein